MSATSSSNPQSETFYATDPLESDLLYQGEILVDVPILRMPLPSRWLLLRTQSGKPVDAALNYGAGAKENRVRVLDSNQSALEWSNGNQGDFVMGVLHKAPVLVVSQNCDLATKDYAHVAPIFPVDPDDDFKLSSLLGGAIMDAFSLNPHPPHWDSYAFADLGLLQAVHKSYFKRVLADKHFRLSASTVLQLQRHLSRFFGRPNAFDIKTDVVPRDGVYMCIRCFYFGAKVTSMDLKAGARFQLCPDCESGQWVPHLGSIRGS